MDVPLSSTLCTSWTLLVLLTLGVCSVEGTENTLYPYGTGAGDQSVGPIGSQVNVPIPTGVAPIKYYGQAFRNAYILKDGMIAFEPGVNYIPEVKWKEGTPNPAIDLPFIAPFHYNGYIAVNNPDQYPGKIYYKLITRCRSCAVLNPTDTAFVESQDSYVQSASVILKKGFASEFVLKVTWENVTSKEACNGTYSTCPSNTFQVVLVGNALHTFAIFNYYKMDIPFDEHQLAGMNGGHGRGWTDVVPCTGACAKRSKKDPVRIRSLGERAGSDVQGRYVLVVDGDRIYRGGCVPAALKDGALEVYPRQAGMFGGEMLSVSGKCLEPGTDIFCRFAGKEVSRGKMETRMRGRCPVPILTTRGEVTVELSADNLSWPTKTTMTIILPSRLPLPVNITSIIDDWYSINAQQLRLRWTSDLFSSNGQAELDLNLIGFREDGYGENKLVFKTLEQLAAGVANSAQNYEVQTSQFSCKTDCDQFEIALIQLKIRDDDVDETTKYQSVTLGPVTLGWYVKQWMTQRYGTSLWSGKKCVDWNNQDKLTTAWLDHLLPCPCTLTQALADWGRWQPDVGCSMYTGSRCTYHHNAKHCVRSVHPSPDGSGNQCCYEQDGNLRYAADTYQGSTPDRSHDWGATPYGVPGRVPSLSHWLTDVVTFYYCCLWVKDYSECDYYMTRRATKDCKQYVPPHAATVYGDPHITTFDGKSYYFGGSGDFWLLKSDTINIQGRFEPRQNTFLQINNNQFPPTNLTSIVLWTPNSDVITVRKAPPGGPENRKLDIMVGSERRFFEDAVTMWQDFKGVSITNNKVVATNAVDQMHSNFTILFDGGAGVQVAERQGLFHVVVVLPPNSGQTRGLLGTLDGDVTNEFTTPQGRVISANAGEQTVYVDFAMTWNVPESDSKFVWPRTVVDDKYPLMGDPMSFIYQNPSSKPQEPEVQRTCGTSQSCRRDYYVTNDATVAQASKTAEQDFASLTASQVIVHSCGLLDIPNAAKTPTIYLQNSMVRVTGCRDNSPFQTKGPTLYRCNSTAGAMPEWSPLPDRNLCPHTTANTTAVAPGGGNEIRHDVTCGETEMSFSIPIPTNVTIPQIVTLSDPRCHLDTGGHRLQGRTPLNDCGTKVAFINDKVVFTNDIYLTYDKGSGSDLVIPIHCSYNRSDDLRLSYLPIVRQVLFTEEGVGHFGFAIQQFQDASYSAPVNEASYPLRVRPQQEVFVQLKLDEADLPVAASHPQAYGIEVEMCIASPSASMTEARQGQHQELIVNGCPANNGVRLLNNDNHGTSSSLTTATPAHPHDNIFRFCFEGVTFSSLPSGSPSGLVYIHCHVALCPRDKCRPSNASCPETPAADPAEAVPESDGHHVARRSVGAWRSQAAGHSLSTGPLWIIAVSEETNASSSPAVIALSVVAAVACLVAIAVIVAWRRGPRRGGGHYERVKVTEE